MHKNQNILKPIVGKRDPVKIKVGGPNPNKGASGGIIVGTGLQKGNSDASDSTPKEK